MISDQVDRYKAAGIDAMVAKPIEVKLLAQAIEEQVAKMTKGSANALAS